MQVMGVEIIGVTPRLNFDTFFSSFTTVFIIWTLTDWSFIMQVRTSARESRHTYAHTHAHTRTLTHIIWTLTDWSFTMQPLLVELSATAVVYFALMILVGNFFLQNLLAAAVIVEFRDRAHVRRIIELRDAGMRVKDRFLALSGKPKTLGEEHLMSKEELRRQNLKEFAEREKMRKELEEQKEQQKVEARLAALERIGKGREDLEAEMEHRGPKPPILERVRAWMAGKCERAGNKIATGAAETTW